jgi:hypothetical protein
MSNMKNTPKTGRIYHVVDKMTGEIVKVGSTVSTLRRRWCAYDKQRYCNHFLKEVRQIESSDLDWYEPKNPFCPFLWHLVASEHIEIVKQGTFRIGKLSNRHSPLDQKSRGFDVTAISEDAGRLAGAIRVSMDDWEEVSAKGRAAAWESNRINPAIAELGRVQGRKNSESGHMAAIQKLGRSLGGAAGCATNHAKKNEFGKSIHAIKMGSIGGKKGGIASNHLRWHVKRGLTSSDCPLCKS